MDDLVLALKSANTSRSEKRREMVKIDYYSRLFGYIESRFSDGESYTIKNYFECYSLITKDLKGNDKTVYGLIATNGKTYLGLNDLAFPKKLWKREIRKVDNEETTTYSQIEGKTYQGDLAILFEAFKSRYKDALIAFDLLFMALAKHNASSFVSESFIYPTETFQRFKGEYSTGNFYLFNLKLGGTDKDKLTEIVSDICEIYEKSIAETEIVADATPAETA
jgi:hypothetical protein